MNSNANNYLKPEELEMLKEKFISEFCKERGWKKTALTQEQLLEIMSQSGYKNPGMIKS